MHVRFVQNGGMHLFGHLARRAAAVLTALGMSVGVLAVASPANAADDSLQPRLSVAQLQQLMASGSVTVIDLTGAGTSASVQKSDKFPKGKVYRTDSWHPPRALQPLTGYTEFIVCDTLGSQVWTVVQNPNDVPAPFDFAVSSATWEGYEGRQYASPGWNILITVMGPGIYHYTGGWNDQRLTFFDDDLTVTCVKPPDPEWPPTNR